jgi:hypothetical protein|tara:strand:- start:61 stop:177 length:117 start_codon:yes stop_codon:yes gene_type:complete
MDDYFDEEEVIQSQIEADAEERLIDEQIEEQIKEQENV